jgi:hypothetical protein
MELKSPKKKQIMTIVTFKNGQF